MIGDRVLVVAGWSTFYGQRGRITSYEPRTMVLIDGEKKPMRFGESEIVVESTPRNIGGAE